MINVTGWKRNPRRKILTGSRSWELHIRGEILLKISSWALAHAVIWLWFRKGAWKEKVEERRAKRQGGFRWPRRGGETPLKLRKSKILFIFCSLQFLAEQSWCLRRFGAQEPHVGSLTAWSEAGWIHLHIFWARFRPPASVAGCSFRLMLQGKVQVMSAAATKAARFQLI